MKLHSDNPGRKPLLNENSKAHLSDTFIPESAFKSSENDFEMIENKLSDNETFKEGVSLFLMKQWDDALRKLLFIHTGSFSEKDQTELAYYIGLCCAKLEREDASVYLEQVISAGTDILRVYQCRLALAYVYVKNGKARMAEFELRRLQNAGFESAPLYNTLAYSAYIQKRNQDAIEFYERTLTIDEDNATALNGLGYILADTGLDKKKGLRLCRRAVEQYPKNPAYLDSLGWAYYKCGEQSEARTLLRRAMELAPHEKEIKKHMSIITGEAV